MAPIFTGFRFGFGSSSATSSSPTTFDTLVATDVYTSPFTSTSRSYTKLEFILVGAGGADNVPFPSQPVDTAQTAGGGQGGFTVARFIIPTSTTLLYAVGSTGQGGTPGPGAGGAGWDASTGAGGPGYSQYAPGGNLGGGGGGGLTGVFATPSAPGISQSTALAIAGGGGGNRYNGSNGGNGGGLTADAAPSPGTGGGGGGGTQLAGGVGGADQPGALFATPGGPLVGGRNGADTGLGPEAYGGGGGGSGYYGGGGGGASSTTSGVNSAGGGGGSGHIKTSSPFYVPSPTVERNYTGMGAPNMGTGGGGPYPLGAGKDHPQIAPYWASSPTKYGAGYMPGILIVNYYA